MPSPSPHSVPLVVEDSKTTVPSLQTLRRQVEKETALGLSWDTAVQLRVIQELIAVRLALETSFGASNDAGYTEDGSTSSSTPERTGGVEGRVRKARGRPRKGS